MGRYIGVLLWKNCRGRKWRQFEELLVVCAHGISRLVQLAYPEFNSES